MTNTEDKTTQHNLALLRKAFNEFELHTQLHGIELRDYFRVLSEEQYWIRNALPGLEDRGGIVSIEPLTDEELQRQKDLKADMKNIEEEAYEYVMNRDAEQMKEDSTGELFEPEKGDNVVMVQKKKDEQKPNFCVDCGMQAEEYEVGRSMEECSKLKFCKVCSELHIATHNWSGRDD